MTVKEIWSTFTLFVMRVSFYVWMWSRGYSTWSKIHRMLFDRESVRRGIVLPTFKNPSEIVPFLNGMTWRQDSWYNLGDSCCTAEQVWMQYLYPETINKNDGLDCDEFAVFLSNTIEKSIKEGVWKSSIDRPEIMTVCWRNAEGINEGHNVCLIRLGNIYGYMDYGQPQWVGDVDRVASAVAYCYGGANNKLLGYARHTPGLKFKEVRWG